MKKICELEKKYVNMKKEYELEKKM